MSNNEPNANAATIASITARLKEIDAQKKIEAEAAAKEAKLIDADDHATIRPDGSKRPKYVPLTDVEYAALRPCVYVHRTQNDSRDLLDGLLAWAIGASPLSEVNQAAKNSFAREQHRLTFYVPMLRHAMASTLSEERLNAIRWLVVKSALSRRACYDPHAQKRVQDLLDQFPLGVTDGEESDIRKRHSDVPRSQRYRDSMLKNQHKPRGT